ncbi:MAG: 50S ribosomal protein L15e [Nanoarchaeota archaeon]
MVKGVAHYLDEAWKAPSREMLHSRMIQWRAGNSIVKVEKPLRISKARALGYKAKTGVVVVRVRVKRGGRQRSRHKHGRKSRKQHVMKILKMNYRWVAEIRAQNYFKNLEVLNSYQIGKDGKYYFYEIIMIDPQRNEIKKDRQLAWICDPANSKRALRGLTSAAKKSRGLRTKSHNMKVRPSGRAWGRRGK